MFSPEAQAALQDAKTALHVAARLDEQKQYGPAADNYVVGLNHLMNVYETLTKGSETANKIKAQIENYMSRAEMVRKLVKQTCKVESVETRTIEEDSVGHSYESIFKNVLNEKITTVYIEEPYLEHPFQMYNLVRFCELLIVRAPNLKRVFLTTKSIAHKTGLAELTKSLKSHGVVFCTEYKDIHDREIRFDNGNIVKIGRGLDIYKRVDQFAIGSCDFNMRPCRNTVINFYKMVAN